MKTHNYIPDDITADILLRLPPKSLLRFKTTCKSWYSLISHSSFITLHTHRASQNPKFLFSERSSEFHLFDSGSSTFNASCFSTLIFPFESSGYCFYRFLGSSCGLLCLTNGIKIYLWNPFTRELRKIPYPIPSARRNRYWSMFYDAHGLGYDPASNDLKLVLCKDNKTFYVFSVKSNSWKSFSCPPNFISNRYAEPGREATVVNGVFHWLRFQQHANDPQLIAFDSTKGWLLNLPIPQVYNPRNACLLEHQGCLCISFAISNVEEMWMLKEHAWVHFLSVSLESPPELGRPIYISKSGTEVLFYHERYILRSKNERFDQIIYLFYLPIHEAIMCCETLVSPNRFILNEPTEKEEAKKQKSCSRCIFCPPFPLFSIKL